MEKYLINDIGLKFDISQLLIDKFGLVVFDANEMTEKLLAWEIWNNFDPLTTLIILPGNGASIVKKFIKNICPGWFEKWPLIFNPYAKRFWQPGEDPSVCVHRVDSEKMFLGIKIVLVVDDVISSGSTVKKLRKINQPWIPGAEWQAFAWIKQKSAATKGFQVVKAVESTGEKNRKAPVNSLSTLVKNQDIAKSFAQRNLCSKADNFLSILKNLQ